jgi:hypothetical protein
MSTRQTICLYNALSTNVQYATCVEYAKCFLGDEKERSGTQTGSKGCTVVSMISRYGLEKSTLNAIEQFLSSRYH